jgi:hypothetical protein
MKAGGSPGFFFARPVRPHNECDMPLILSFLLRAVLVLAGLAVVAGVLAVFVVLLALWSLRALWARLTGRPVMAFAMRMGPRHAFAEMMRRAQAPADAGRTPRADAARGVGGRLADVTDVEPK